MTTGPLTVFFHSESQWKQKGIERGIPMPLTEHRDSPCLFRSFYGQRLQVGILRFRIEAGTLLDHKSPDHKTSPRD